jgi:hypothetical protein
MKRFIVYIKLKGKYAESLVAEGIEFNNHNVALHEILTTTILVLDGIDSIYKHYKVIGKVRIKWIDLDYYEEIIH